VIETVDDGSESVFVIGIELMGEKSVQYPDGDGVGNFFSEFDSLLECGNGESVATTSRDEGLGYGQKAVAVSVGFDYGNDLFLRETT